MPLATVVTDFYDKLKSASSGYASLNYELADYRPADVERLDIIVANDLVEALSTLVYRDWAYGDGRRVVDKLKDILPRQMFEVKIQAVLNYQKVGKNAGGKIIASSRIPAMKKDVMAKMSGGDVTRKMKLLRKQKEGKKKMMAQGMGRVDIPQEAFTAVLKRE
jgi:GTP-binding protein LepA